MDDGEGYFTTTMDPLAVTRKQVHQALLDLEALGDNSTVVFANDIMFGPAVNRVEYEYVAVYTALMKPITLMNTMAALLGGYLIIWRSPAAIQHYKWFLLNVVICSYISDTFQTVFYVPFMLPPMFGGCAFGLLKYLETKMHIRLGLMPWLIMQELLGVVGMSLISALLFRRLSLHGTLTQYFKHPFIIFCLVVLHLGFSIPMVFWSNKLAPSDEVETLDFIKKTFPETYLYYRNHICAAFTINYQAAWNYGLVALGQLSLGMVSAITLVAGTIHRLHLRRHLISKKTFELHRSLLKALVIQLMVPIVLIFCSYFTFGFMTLIHVRARYHPQSITVLMFTLATVHSTANVVVMIAFTRPYRITVGKMYQHAIAKITGRSQVGPMQADVAEAWPSHMPTSSMPPNAGDMMDDFLEKVQTIEVLRDDCSTTDHSIRTVDFNAIGSKPKKI